MSVAPLGVRVPGLPEPISHYTDAVQVGGLLYISGCTGAGPDGTVTSDDVTEQTRVALASIGACLAAVAASPAHVVKVTVYLHDVDDRASINPVRQEFFGPHLPASTLVEISRLAVPGAKVEIEAVAAVPNGGGPDGAVR